MHTSNQKGCLLMIHYVNVSEHIYDEVAITVVCLLNPIV